jgi:hypothetical protein
MIKILTLALILCSCAVASFENKSPTTFKQNSTNTTSERTLLNSTDENKSSTAVKDDSGNEFSIDAKFFANLAGVILTVLGGFFVAYIVQKAPRDMVKLEKLKMINTLATNKAWLKPEQYLVIEEAYMQYYMCYISVDTIKLLHGLHNRVEAFSAYKAVAPYCTYNQTTGKIVTYSKRAQNWRKAFQASLIFLFFNMAVFSASTAIRFFTSNQSQIPFFATIVFSTALAVISLYSIYFSIRAFYESLKIGEDFARLEKALPELVEFEKSNPSDKIGALVIFALVIFVDIFAPILIFLATKFYE